jgi:hypothetical protein
MQSKHCVDTASEPLNDCHSARIPVWFRSPEIDSGAEECSTETVCISSQCFVMASPKRLRIGSLLSLRMRVPVEISGSARREMRASGRVESEEQLEDGSIGYKVIIEPTSRRS